MSRTLHREQAATLHQTTISQPHVSQGRQMCKPNYFLNMHSPFFGLASVPCSPMYMSNTDLLQPATSLDSALGISTSLLGQSVWPSLPGSQSLYEESCFRSTWPTATPSGTTSAYDLKSLPCPMCPDSWRRSSTFSLGRPNNTTQPFQVSYSSSCPGSHRLSY